MHFTTVFSLLFASWTLLSGSIGVYAAPVPSRVGSTWARQCTMYACRIDTPSESSTVTDVTSQSTDVQKLVSLLMGALQSYQQTEGTPSNTTSTVDLATPEEDNPSEPIPVIDALLGDTAPVTDTV